MVATMGISLLLFVFSSLSNAKEIGYNPTEMQKISHGIFLITLVCQFLALGVLLPISMATSITMEKERNSLELLLLTKMKVWTIIMQKYLSRVIPAFMFLFLSFPMIAIAYSFGGFDIDSVKYIIFELFFSIFYVAAWAILWSSFCRRSSGAVILTYITIAINGLLFFLLYPRPWSYSLAPIEAYFMQWYWVEAILTIILLVLAAIFLKTRVHTRRRNLFLSALSKLDAFWKAVNHKLGDVEFLESDNYKFPKMNPIIWYEKYKKPTGRIGYLFRIFLLLLIPCLGAGIMLCIKSNLYYLGDYIAIGLLLIAMIYLILQASAIVANERINQTLDLLLTTSVMPKDIVASKMRTLFKLHFVISTPILIILFMVHYFRQTSGGGYYQDHFYIIVVYLLVHLSFISWFSCWVGLKVKTHHKAMLIIFISLALWFVFPIISTLLISNNNGTGYYYSRPHLEVNLENIILCISPTFVFYAGNLWYIFLYIPGFLYIWYWTRRAKTHLRSIFSFIGVLALWMAIPLFPFFSYFDVNYTVHCDKIIDLLPYLSPLSSFLLDKWNFSYLLFILSSIFIFILYLHFRALSIFNADKYLRK
jgi:ABC-type transport system involved in multi-copper enzyme maturation permease subunit